MKHPILNRMLGWSFMAAIAVSYVIVIGPIQLYLILRKRKRDLAYVGHYYFNIVFRIFRVQLQVEGRENIPQGQSFVVLSNHQSFIDIGCLISVICPLAFLAKIELFKTPFFGNSLRFMGCIPVDRGNREANEALPGIMQGRIRDEHYNYCIFPEGTRSVSGELLPFKNGIFRMVKDAPVPVLPVTLIGSGKVMPKKGLSLYPGKIRLVIHPVILPAHIEAWTVHQLRDQVRDTIASKLLN
jgi:1-acyl-sn-glycerol-3-phosphate acyltransferase